MEPINEEVVDEAIEAVQKSIDTQPTLNTCLCTWRVHPDDSHKPRDEKRRIRIDEHAACPVHTRRGFTIQVLQHMFGTLGFALIDVTVPNTPSDVGEW